MNMSTSDMHVIVAQVLNSPDYKDNNFIVMLQQLNQVDNGMLRILSGKGMRFHVSNYFMKNVERMKEWDSWKIGVNE